MVIVVTIMLGVSPECSGGSGVYLFEYCNCQCSLFGIVGCLIVFCEARDYYGHNALAVCLLISLRPMSLVGLLGSLVRSPGLADLFEWVLIRLLELIQNWCSADLVS